MEVSRGGGEGVCLLLGPCGDCLSALRFDHGPLIRRRWGMSSQPEMRFPSGPPSLQPSSSCPLKHPPLREAPEEELLLSSTSTPFPVCDGLTWGHAMAMA